MTTKTLWATKVGDEDWQEQLITEVAANIPGALVWCAANGFNRTRIGETDLAERPDFTKTLNTPRS